MNFRVLNWLFCRVILSLCLLILSTSIEGQRHVLGVEVDITIADFESDTYGDWKTEGEAFGTRPAQGTLAGQMHVSGYSGKGLVNSFNGGDDAVGKLTSPVFKIDRPWMNFLIGGGAHEGRTCMNLLIDGKVVRTVTGPNLVSGGSEELERSSLDLSSLLGRSAQIEIVDRQRGVWGHINVDQIELSYDRKGSTQVLQDKLMKCNGTHLIVPIANVGKSAQLGIYVDDKLVQSFNVVLPSATEPYWLAAYPITQLGIEGKMIRLSSVHGAKVPVAAKAAFDQIHVGNSKEGEKADDYSHPYRDQFHVSTRRGWNNDPNGMVFHEGKFHLYYQYNPFGISWGNMHWGHFESTDLIHWSEMPIALYQRTVNDMMFSGGGFIDTNNSAGEGNNTLFVAFTSTGRGECIAYSKDGGLTFKEIEENPVVKHSGRDPKIIWYAPERKWVMVVFDETECDETRATPSNAKSPDETTRWNFAFYESKDLRQWNRTGAFTHPDRFAVFECPEMFELPILGRPDETKWILFGAQNRYFIGEFDGKTFVSESGPHGGSRGALYAAQTFSNTSERRIQMGWIRTNIAPDRYPNQIVSQSFTLPQEVSLRETTEGLRVYLQPVAEVEALRSRSLDLRGNDLKSCQDKSTEIIIEFEQGGTHRVSINGIDATFSGHDARIFTDRNFNEVYVDGGLNYFSNARSPSNLDSRETVIDTASLKSIQGFELKSIWHTTETTNVNSERP